MTSWVLIATTHEPWVAGEARYDGTFTTYDEAQRSFVTDMTAAGIDAWRASSPRDIGFFRRLWWTGPIATGQTVGGWEPWLPAPSIKGARVITIREVCGEFFTALNYAKSAGQQPQPAKG